MAIKNDTILGGSPESKTAYVLAAQTWEALLGKLLQVVGSLIVDHHSQDETIRHAIHVLGKATALILTAVRVEPEEVKATLLFWCCWNVFTLTFIILSCFEVGVRLCQLIQVLN